MRLAIAALAALALAGCAQDPSPGGTDVYQGVQPEVNGSVEIVTIMGMPCIVWDGPEYTSGITCDWSQFEG